MNAGATARMVEIHVASPNGPLFYAGSATGKATAQGWVTEGSRFYLQDVSDNQPRTLNNTIATAVAHLSLAEFSANPPFIVLPNALGMGSMTFNWNVPGAQYVEIHLNSPSGPLLTYQGPSGWTSADGWVSEGMKFYLCDVSEGACSPQNTVATLTTHVVNDAQAQASGGGTSLIAFPNPIVLAPGQSFGQTTLYWRGLGNYLLSEMAIHLNAPAGPLLAIGLTSGSAQTGTWVTNGMTFYLTDPTGFPLTSTKVIVIPAAPQ
jgi:hypothetical protein